MLRRCLIRRLFISLVFYFVTATVVASDYYESDSMHDEVITSEEKILDLEETILNKLKTLDRLQDMINKGSQNEADNKRSLAAMEKRLLDLEDKINKSLNVIEKIPESLEKAQQRLDALGEGSKPKEQNKKLKDVVEKLDIFTSKLDSFGKWSLETKSLTGLTLKAVQSINKRLESFEKSPKPSDRFSRVPSTKSDQDLRESENMVKNLEKDYITNNKLYNENLKTEMLEADGVDKALIERSGCKYSSLKYEDVQVFQTDNDTTSRLTVAYNELAKYRHVRKAHFESHIAIRATGDVHILLWEVDVPVLAGTLKPDYEIGLGVKESSNRITSTLKLKNGNLWREATPNILTLDQYKKMYIKVYDDALEFGFRCDEALHVHNLRPRGNVVAIGFLSKSTEPVKILFDCPATACAEPL